MFQTIFRYELRFWFRQPSVYVYAAIFLAISAGAMAAQAGIFGEQRAIHGLVPVANSPLMIHEMAGFFLKLILFLIPAIIGLSVYRDVKSNIHPLLYSYPFVKSSYLSAKFLSSFTVLGFIVSAIGVGFFVGARLPGVNPLLVGPFRPAAYLQTYFVYILPNILLFGAVIFMVVALTRNIYAGFITIVLLLLLQKITESLLGGLSDFFTLAILDPFGQSAVAYHTRYWTFAERNELTLPVKGAVIYNRLLWLAIAALFFGLGYRKFAFHHFALSPGGRKGREERNLKANLGRLIRVALPDAGYDFSLRQQLIATCRIAAVEFAYILKSWLFLSILAGGILMVFFQQAEMSPPYGFRTLPATWKMLRIPAFLFLGVIHLLTFLYAGMLVQRARLARMDQLVDASPLPNWALLLSKLMALVMMQIGLLSLIMIAGVVVQALNGYYQFEIGLYLFQLFGLYLPGLIIWALAALFVQTLFTNPYLGLFLLILGSMGVAGLPDLGVEHFVFRYNLAPEFSYSALDGFGATLAPWLLYKSYWMLAGLFLLMGALLLWIRGIPVSFSERLAIAKSRFRGHTAFFTLFFLFAFLALGAGIYYEDIFLYPKINTAAEEEQWKVENERRYKKYEHRVQPRIVGVDLNVHLFPASRDLRADGIYTLVNKSGQRIDTLLVHHSYDEETQYRFDRPVRTVSRDTFIRFDVHLLERGLEPGDSLKLYFQLNNEPNGLFRSSSPVRGNGTFFTNDIFPGLGYRPLELADNGARAQHGLPPKKGERPYPEDSTAHYDSYSSMDSDWIAFEATVSTSEDQIALAPGYLQRSWVDKGRRYFHYKMDSPIKDYYGFNSGRYLVERDKWGDVGLEIYYHPGHGYNLENMMNGLKGALAYNSRYFGSYQHRQARIIEFPMTAGGFATTFANSIPFTEKQFMADVDSTEADFIDFPFYVAAHEMAHQWWGNQLLPADVLGARMLTESLAEYTALKVLEKQYGKAGMRRFLKLNLDLYLRGRGKESRQERPLIYAELDQDYINYRKGALAFYALSDYVGEAQLNAALRTYLDKVRFQDAPYTTSLEMLGYLREATPDSLSYLIEDLFETITLYDNRIKEARVAPLQDGRYQVEIEFIVSKYRSNGSGERSFITGNAPLSLEEGSTEAPVRSIPLQDYVELGIFGQAEEEVYFQKHKITQVDNKLVVITNSRPVAVAIDPYCKLIDANTEDNRKWVR